ncbi:hypothetical protein PHYSODRAFT_503103, partial [Phytophthora sojae]
MPAKSKKPALQRAKELCGNDTPLEEGDHWFAVAKPWWDDFQACKRAEDAPSVRNDPLIDKQLSSKTRTVSVLKPNLEEGPDFVFMPEFSWEVFARELDFDWEIRREVVYERSRQQMEIEAYPLTFKQKLQGAANSGEMEWPSQGLEMQWRMDLAKGDLLDALDTSKTWFEARILGARRNKVHVHYRSWEPKWDEWIPRTSARIAPLHSKVPKWRSTLRSHSLVQVGIEVPTLQHPRWRNATVIEEDGAGLRVHVQVDEDDIWLPANDDLLCRPNTHNES